MWETSKIPTPVRTARCSLTSPKPGYSMGISQPPKSTILAPIWRCRRLRAVLRKAGVVASAIGDNRNLYAAELALAEGKISAEPVTLTRAFFLGQRLAATGRRGRGALRARVNRTDYRCALRAD